MRYFPLLLFSILILVKAFSTNSYAQEGQTNEANQQSLSSVQIEKPQEQGNTQDLAEEQDVFYSQQPVTIETRTGDPLIEDMFARVLIKQPGFLTTQIPSLLFTSWEQALIEEAREGLMARPATESEIRQAEEWQKEGTRPPRGPREIALGGIVYISHGDWTVWLNNQRITPNAIPPEVLDIHVHRHYIKIKWFDAYTNQIFPIKIRPHQRFNIDTRIFLPG